MKTAHRPGKVFALSVTSMPQVPRTEVFTLDELARAAGVPRSAAESVSRSGGLRPVGGTTYFTVTDARRTAERLRAAAILGALPAPDRAFLSQITRPSASGADRNRLPLLASSCAHGLLLVLALCLTAGTPQSASALVAQEPARLVFVMSPGPGGGGGGSGARAPQPAPAVERRGADRTKVSVPAATPDPARTSRTEEHEPVPRSMPDPTREQAPEPLAARTVIAPVVVTAASAREQAGVVEHPAPGSSSPGPGVGGDAGSGRGLGNGEGLGDGIGDGAGGGAGGGPYRPGSGIQPPRLLREVKADYTEDARRQGITGSVLLEIVVLRDGTVGKITVRRSLPRGLDDQAVAAVRQWRFAPARRLGQPVDVIVEVAVEFTLR